MRIRQLADASGVTPDTIRYYEAQGLLPRSSRTSAGYRVFNTRDLVRLQFVTRAKRLGFSLSEIKDVLRLHDLREQPCHHVRTLLDAKIFHLERLLHDLHDLKAELVDLRERAESQVGPLPASGCICGIIEQASGRHGRIGMAWLSKRGNVKAQSLQPQNEL